VVSERQRRYWEAKAWRHEQLELAGNGLLYAPSHLNLAEVAAVWIAMAHEGRIPLRGPHSSLGRRFAFEERADHHDQRPGVSALPIDVRRLVVSMLGGVGNRPQTTPC
jgi:hypothetical protein